MIDETLTWHEFQLFRYFVVFIRVLDVLMTLFIAAEVSKSLYLTNNF